MTYGLDILTRLDLKKGGRLRTLSPPEVVGGEMEAAAARNDPRISWMNKT